MASDQIPKGKTVFTVCVNDYFPELCAITFPLIEAYARRIGAKFHVITERKFPEFPPTYEKLQLGELGRDNEWNILIDADMLVSPLLGDVTRLVDARTVGLFMQYGAETLFQADQYFMRDGRRLGVATNFVVSHNACHDIWTPLEMPASVALTKTKRAHIVDEYCVSRNFARFGIRAVCIDLGWSEPAPFKLSLGQTFTSDIVHLDVSTNDRATVLSVARKQAEEWKTIRL